MARWHHPGEKAKVVVQVLQHLVHSASLGAAAMAVEVCGPYSLLLFGTSGCWLKLFMLECKCDRVCKCGCVCCCRKSSS
jgi:hypothetical protein